MLASGLHHASGLSVPSADGMRLKLCGAMCGAWEEDVEATKRIVRTCYSLKDFLRYLSGGLVLGECVWVGKTVV